MKKRIIAVILAALCFMMVLPMTAFATGTLISSVSMSTDFSRYVLGNSSYDMMTYFNVAETVPETSSVVTCLSTPYVEDGESWTYVGLEDTIDAGKKYKVEICFYVSLLYDDEYYLDNTTVINYDTESFENAGVTLTEITGDKGEICFEAIFPALEPEISIEGIEPEDLTVEVGSSYDFSILFSKELPDGYMYSNKTSDQLESTPIAYVRNGGLHEDRQGIDVEVIACREGTSDIIIDIYDTKNNLVAEGTYTLTVIPKQPKTVTFDTKGGSAAPASQSVEAYGKVTKPNDPTKDGYIFKGWYILEEDTYNLWDFEYDYVTEDITLVAMWNTPVATSVEGPSADSGATADEAALKAIADYYGEISIADKLVVKLDVVKNAVTSEEDKKLIEEKTAGKTVEYNSVILYLQEQNDPAVDIGDNNKTLIPVTYKFDFTNKKDIQVLRVHNGVVDELTTTPNADGEYVVFDEANGTITVVAYKFSTYAFAYTATVSPKTGDTTNTVLYAVLGVSALMATAAVVILRKKEN